MDDKQEALVLENMPLVKWVLDKYIHTPPGLYDDLLQEGYLGLSKAAATYEEAKGKFATYAVNCILNQIRMYLRKDEYLKMSRAYYKDTGEPFVVASLDGELTESGFQLLHVLEDECALDDLNVEILEDTILQEAQRILSTYTKQHADICLEDLCSKMWDEPPRQCYLAHKYGMSQSYVSRVLRKFYADLKLK